MYQPNYSRGELPGHKSRRQEDGCSLFHGLKKKKNHATCFHNSIKTSGCAELKLILANRSKHVCIQTWLQITGTLNILRIWSRSPCPDRPFKMNDLQRDKQLEQLITISCSFIICYKSGARCRFYRPIDTGLVITCCKRPFQTKHLHPQVLNIHHHYLFVSESNWL